MYKMNAEMLKFPFGRSKRTQSRTVKQDVTLLEAEEGYAVDQRRWGKIIKSLTPRMGEDGQL